MGKNSKSDQLRLLCLRLKEDLISVMSPIVNLKIEQSGFTCEDVITAYLIQLVNTELTTDEQIQVNYYSFNTGNPLPQFVYLDFNADGTSVIDIIIA